MSLINQMLRDLEKRRKSVDKQAPQGAGQAVAAAQGSSHRVAYLALAGIALIVVIWAAMVMVPGQQQITEPSLSKQPAKGQAAELKVSASPAAKADEVAKEKNTSEVAGQAAPPQETHSQLLKVGLIEESASARLVLEFENKPVFSWMLRGADKDQLEILLQRTVRSDALDLPAFSGQILKGLSSETDEDGLLFNVKLQKGSTFNILELPADKFYGERLLFEFTAAPKKQSRKPVVAAVKTQPKKSLPAVQSKKTAAKKLTKKAIPLSPAEKAALAYQTGLKDLQASDFRTAESNFSKALLLQPRLLDARMQLVDLLQQQQKTKELISVLEDGLKLSPSEPSLRKTYARQLMAAGQLSQAINVLFLKPMPKLSRDLEYYALLAALQQEVGQHSSAIETYQKLLQHRPQEALWWLGLAISFDQSGNAVKAKEAYQKVSSLPGLRADLKDYVQNRLQVL